MLIRAFKFLASGPSTACVFAGDGGITKEELPHPFVWYPRMYAPFLGFSDSEFSEVYLCECARQAAQSVVSMNVRMRKYRHDFIKGGNDGRAIDDAHYISSFFPQPISALVRNGRFAEVKYISSGCHRCNLVVPFANYCLPMYGGLFKQKFGWYEQLERLSIGIFSVYPCVVVDETLCPDDVRKSLELDLYFCNTLEHYFEANSIDSVERTKVIDRVTDLARSGITAADAKRQYKRLVDNRVRVSFAYKNVGEGWVREALMLSVIRHVYRDEVVLHGSRPSWLHGLELDAYIPALRIAFEHQGIQHFEAVKAWGGRTALQALQLRDARKAELCKDNGVTLLYFNFDEQIDAITVRQKVKNASIMR